MITGIILASGFSNRMKRDKLLMEIEGTPMVERVIQSSIKSKLDEVILVYRVNKVKKLGIKYGVKLVYNPKAHLGQSEGLKLGIKEAKPGAYMFLMGDMPFITKDLINRLIEEFIKDKSNIIVPYYNNKRGMPTIFPYSLREELLNIEGDIGGRRIIEDNPFLVKKVYIDNCILGLDIDTQEEYKRWDSGDGFPVLEKEGEKMDLVVVRGGGDIASGIIHRLYMAGFKVVVLEIEKPLTIRRTVAFSEAVYEKEVNIEGVKGVLAKDTNDIWNILDEGSVPVYIDEKGKILEVLKPMAVVDAILAKINLGTHRDMAPITIGVGPGFEAGVDVDLVVESKRGHNLGKVIYKGKTAKNTGIPGETLGFREERVIRAPGEGVVKPLYYIGDKVKKGDIVCKVGEEEVIAQIDGILRGMIKEGLYIHKGLKIGDIDPRGVREYAFTISDKARAIGGGVLEGILYLKNERRK